jgi:glycosyltransferase involved in cell wall biosynthesis
MRVLHYKPTMRAEEGGVVKAVFDMCVLTASDTLQVGLATHHTELVRENLPAPAAELIGLHSLALPRDRTARLLGRASLAEIARIIEPYDLVHLHEMWTTSNPQIAAVCHRLGKPYILSVHGMLDDWCMAQRSLKKRVYLATWARHLLPRAARVLCTADAELAQAGRWFDRTKGEVIPLPMDLSMYWRLPGPGAAHQAFPVIDPARPRVLFLSRLHPKKGADRLIRASALLHRQGVDHQLLIAGTGTPGYTRWLSNLARAEGVAQSTHFLGFVAGMLKVSLLQAADVFALPTSQENFGFVFFESLAAGTPVVTTGETDTWPELERSGGAVVAENTPESFAERIAGLLADTPRARSMGQTARQWVLRSHDRSHTAGRYERFYKHCLEHAP